MTVRNGWPVRFYEPLTYPFTLADQPQWVQDRISEVRRLLRVGEEK